MMQWNPLPSDNRIEVSCDGQVRRRINVSHPERNKPYLLLKQNTDKDGYKRVSINKRNRLVHRLVYEAFIGSLKDGLVVCHLNNDKSDNRYSNLLQA